MSKLLLLLTIILTGIVFLVIPFDPIPLKEITVNGVVYIQKDNPNLISFFPFSSVKLYPKTYIYFIFEKLIVIVLAYMIAADERQFKFETKVFFWLMVADLFDYLLSYGAVWISIGVPVSMNIVKTLIFGLVILRAWIK